MDAVGLALVSAALFGAMPVAVRFALVPPMVPAAVGALFMQIATFAVLCVAAAIQGGVTLAGIAPFLLAGAIAPGVSNLFITVGIREAGSSRASVAFGMAPLFAVTIAVLVFDERPGALVLFGAVLIVCGGVALALEPERPRHVRRIGIAFALVGAALFALRDNLVRDESLDTVVPSMTAGAAMLGVGPRRDVYLSFSPAGTGWRGPRRVVGPVAAPGRIRRALVHRALRGVLPRHRLGGRPDRRDGVAVRRLSSRRCCCARRSASGRGSCWAPPSWSRAAP